MKKLKLIASYVRLITVINLLLSFFNSFIDKKKKNQILNNISFYCLQQVALCFKDKPNSICFYSGIFLIDTVFLFVLYIYTVTLWLKT